MLTHRFELGLMRWL